MCGSCRGEDSPAANTGAWAAFLQCLSLSLSLFLLDTPIRSRYALPTDSNYLFLLKGSGFLSSTTDGVPWFSHGAHFSTTFPITSQARLPLFHKLKFKANYLFHQRGSAAERRGFQSSTTALSGFRSSATVPSPYMNNLTTSIPPCSSSLFHNLSFSHQTFFGFSLSSSSSSSLSSRNLQSLFFSQEQGKNDFLPSRPTRDALSSARRSPEAGSAAA